MRLLSEIRAHAKVLPVLRHHTRHMIWQSTGAGMFPSFDAAMAHIPSTRSVSYNSEAAAELIRHWPVLQYRPSDYALFFHLRPLLRPGSTLLDLGGSVGITCKVLQQYLEFPPDFTWLVCDLPAIVRVGKEMAGQDHGSPLCFTDSLSVVPRCDVMISCGALQYMKETLAEQLSALTTLPDHVLINRTPVWERKSLYTLQDIATFTCVYRVQNRDEFIKPMQALGYRIRAEWECTENRFCVQYHPSTWLNGYRGFYFVREDKALHRAA